MKKRQTLKEKKEYGRQWKKDNPEKIKKNRKKHKKKRNEYNKQWNKDNPEKTKKNVKKYNQSKKGRYSRYKREAIDRNLNFDLTFEQFIIFWQKPCYYCDSPVKTIELDRVDNNKGYEINNVVPCCATCNWMKKNYSKNEFINHCKKIVQKFE